MLFAAASSAVLLINNTVQQFESESLQFDQ